MFLKNQELMGELKWTLNVQLRMSTNNPICIAYFFEVASAKYIRIRVKYDSS